MIRKGGSGLTRRTFMRGGLAVVALGGLVGCGVVPPSPPPPKPARVGLLSDGGLDPSSEGTAFRQALGELGYAEGRNLLLVPRYGSDRGALVGRAAELVAEGVDVIVAVNDMAAHAARDASAAVPIVTVDSSDPVGSGLAASLARPGGNVTGLSSQTALLSAKRLELLREVVPGLGSVAVMWVSLAVAPPDLSRLEEAARQLGVRLSFMATSHRWNLESPYSVATPGPVDGLIVLTDAYARATFARQIAAWANGRRLPAIFEASAFVREGGLMAYGPNQPDLFRRAVTYVDKILKGARPADLPIEQPTTYDLEINTATARALGLAIAPTLLQQATEIVE